MGKVGEKMGAGETEEKGGGGYRIRQKNLTFFKLK
jgi:hypothetical protein